MERSGQAARVKSGLRQMTPPGPLAALLAIVIAVGLSWALLVAPWQSPDETTHFSYVQSLAENFQLPGVKGRPGMSSDQSFADGSVGASGGALWPEAAPPNWSRSDYATYLARMRGPSPPSRTDGSGPIAADSNPPLYYLFAAGSYLLDHGGTAFGRLYAIRLAGILLLVLTTVAAWLLGGEVFGRRRLPQLACAAVAGLLPMSTFMSTNVNPDALLITTWTFALWLGARVINRGGSRRDTVALCGFTAAAILTKATSYALLVPVLLALFLGWRRRPVAGRRTDIGTLTAAGAVLLVPVLAWVGVAHATGRAAINAVGTSATHPFNGFQFLSYLWQFYLPRLPFLTPFRTTPELPVYNIWLNQGTGVFGWLDVHLPHWMYPLGACVAAAIAIATVALLLRLRGRRRLSLLAFFAVALIALLGLLHITEYRAVIDGSGTFLQGRYLLPVVSLAGLAVGLIIHRLPGRGRPAACALTLTVLLAAQVLSLSAVLQAYYL